MPAVTLGLLLIALVGNWRTPRRRLLLAAVALFIAAGLFAAFVIGPAQEAVTGAGYSDAVDEALRVQALRWHMLDWVSWALTLSVGVVLVPRRPGAGRRRHARRGGETANLDRHLPRSSTEATIGS